MLLISYKKLKTIIQPKYVLFLIILINSIYGFIIVRDFGEAWDENLIYLQAERMVEAYERKFQGLELNTQRQFGLSNLRYYGPAYFVIGNLAVKRLQYWLSEWSSQEIWHLVNFVSYQMSLILLYYLTKRFMRDWIAVGVVLLFASQPLIFGHAFMNPKDIPFMTYFLASVVIGLMMVDRQVCRSQTLDSVGYVRRLPAIGYWAQVILAILFLAFIFAIIGNDVIDALITFGVITIYYANSDTPMGRIFSVLAHQANQLPVELYIQKAIRFYHQTQIVPIILLLIMGIFLSNRFYIGRRVDDRKSSLSFWQEFSIYLNAPTMLAGCVLGLCTSVRVLGPFSGLLVAIYFVWQAGKKALPSLIYYFAISAVVSYLAWPYLWAAPVSRYFETLKMMSQFPWSGMIRFMGSDYSASNLPRSYLPVLLSIQLTIPVVVFSVIGFVITIWQIWKHRDLLAKYILLYEWFVIPLGLIIALQPNMYDNFRQFFFLLPPLFSFVGIALDVVSDHIKYKWVTLLIVLVFSIPGIYGILKLHPYEYIYYNQLVGGLSGASDKFELDYWALSYRKAADYINENAPDNVRVLVWGPKYAVEHYVRSDIDVFGFSSEDQITEKYDYLVIFTRYDIHDNIFPDLEVVYRVEKEGVLLSVVKKFK